MTMQLDVRPTRIKAPALGLLVQLVGPDRAELDLHRRVLERAGALVHAATSGLEALEVARDVGPDVFVCDTHPVDVDGFTVLRALRRIRPQLAHVPAIAIATHRDEDEISEALKAGYHLHVVRPLAPFDLVQMVTALSRSSSLGAAPVWA